MQKAEETDESSVSTVACDWCKKEVAADTLQIWRIWDTELGLWEKDELLCRECFSKAVDENIPY